MPKVAKRFTTRPPMERMLRIHEELQDGSFPNCTKIAEEFEVSTRTIKRDVDFMKCRLNLPIEYDEKSYGYYYNKPVENFPALPVTEAEAFALLVAHKAISQYRGTPFQATLETAFRRLTGRLDTTVRFSMDNLQEALSFRPFAPEDTDLELFEILTRALREHRVVTFDYKKLGETKRQLRKVRPYHLACIDSHWYLFGFDLQRNAIRTFVLSRMKSVELTQERFSAPKDFDPDEYLRGSFTVFKGTDDYEVVLDFDVWATDLARGRRWHPKQEFTELPNGCSRLRLRLNSIELCGSPHNSIYVEQAVMWSR